MFGLKCLLLLVYYYLRYLRHFGLNNTYPYCRGFVLFTRICVDLRDLHLPVYPWQPRHKLKKRPCHLARGQVTVLVPDLTDIANQFLGSAYTAAIQQPLRNKDTLQWFLFKRYIVVSYSDFFRHNCQTHYYYCSPQFRVIWYPCCPYYL